LSSVSGIYDSTHESEFLVGVEFSGIFNLFGHVACITRRSTVHIDVETRVVRDRVKLTLRPRPWCFGVCKPVGVRVRIGSHLHRNHLWRYLERLRHPPLKWSNSSLTVPSLSPSH
jgi:hypothetical protein